MKHDILSEMNYMFLLWIPEQGISLADITAKAQAYRGSYSWQGVASVLCRLRKRKLVRSVRTPTAGKQGAGEVTYFRSHEAVEAMDATQKFYSQHQTHTN